MNITNTALRENLVETAQQTSSITFVDFNISLPFPPDSQEASDRGPGAVQEHQVRVPGADVRRPGAAARQVLQGVPGADGQ